MQHLYKVERHGEATNDIEEPREDVAKDLEKALDLDLAAAGQDIEMAASMEDLEAQISRAAEELSRETKRSRAPCPEPENRMHLARR